MNKVKNTGLVLCGLALGLSLSAPAAQAVESLKATLSTNRIFVDGKETHMTAYTINGNNYVKLRDVGKAVGFEVYWDSANGCVQVESGKPYTGEAPAKAEPDKSVTQPEPTAPANDADVDAMKQDIIDRTNALRKENGIAALTTSDKLMQAAQVDCPYMAENIHRIADWTLSEQTLAEQAVADWNASTTHHKNMLNPKLSEIGIGLARGVNDNGNPCWYCVQLFLYDGYSISWVDTPTNK